MYNFKKSTIGITIRLTFLLVICSLFTLCNNTTSSTQNEIEEVIRKADASVQVAVERKNLDSLISFYAEDAFLLPTAEPIVKGKEAIRAEWSHIFNIPNFNNKSVLAKVEVSKAGDMAYTMGYYEAVMMGEDGNLTKEPGKWVSIWKKQSNGEWRIIVDIYNTDIPPPDHK